MTLPTQLIRRFERALETAQNFKGMSAGSPKVMLEISDVQYLLKWLQAREPETKRFKTNTSGPYDPAQTD